MTEDEKKSLAPLMPLLLSYQDDIDSLNRLESAAEQSFGNDWRDILPLLLEELASAEGETARANLRQALDYENGVLAWDEANRLLEADGIDKNHISERIPALEYWLAIFGDAGKNLVDRLNLLVADMPEDTVPQVSSAEIPPPRQQEFAKELLWNFEHFMRLKDYYDQTISRVGARCVQLGGIEMSHYKYYGYVLDVLDEIVGLGEVISDNDAYDAIIDANFSGKKEAFIRVLAEFKKDLTDNAPPEMLEEDLDAAKIRAGLGGLASEDDEGPIGPAPDGFEPIPDLGDFEPVTDINTTPETVDMEKTAKESTVSIKPDVVRKVVKKIIVKGAPPSAPKA